MTPTDCSSRRSLGQVAALHGLGTVTSVRPGCALTTEGAPGRDAFVVLEGVARVTKDGRLIGEVGPDQFVGEMALIDHGRREVSVVAATPMQVVAFDAPAFEALLADPLVSRELRRQVVERLRAALSSTPLDLQTTQGANS
jgi:CRP-like cAMP-binding protein